MIDYTGWAAEYERDLNVVRDRISAEKEMLRHTRFGARHDEIKNRILRYEEIEDDILYSLNQIERRKNARETDKSF